MRTTLDIDDDVLQAVKELARAEGTTAGRVVSELARRQLVGALGDVETGPFNEVLGFAPLARRGGVVTNELIDSIREEEGI